MCAVSMETLASASSLRKTILYHAYPFTHSSLYTNQPTYLTMFIWSVHFSDLSIISVGSHLSIALSLIITRSSVRTAPRRFAPKGLLFSVIICTFFTYSASEVLVWISTDTEITALSSNFRIVHRNSPGSKGHFVKIHFSVFV
jgi:hypothetical protein